MDRVRRLRGRAHDRDHRPCADPVRGRPERGVPGDPAGPAGGDQPGDARNDRHGGDRRPGGDVALRPLDARGHAAGRGAGGHRRRGGVRDIARIDAAAQGRAHARGRGRAERPRRGAARDRVHRLDPEARLRPGRHGAAAGAASCSSGRRSAARVGLRWPSTGCAARAWRPPASTRWPRRDRRPRLRRGRRGARLGLPRRLPDRARARAARRSRRSGRSPPSTSGSAGSPRSRCS